ncbi:hypothetical protein ACQKWADRAFT_309270 [Trichoderma austrokoningii]
MASNTNYTNNTANDATPAASSAATLVCTVAAVSLVPADDTFRIRRFLSDRDQHPPLGLKQASSEAEVKSKMLVQLRAFEEKFGNSSARN